MTPPPAQASPKITLERSYTANAQDLWELWTTKEGFESWWGPEGFRVEVRKLDLRIGGELHYDMIADAPEQIAAMKSMNMPTSHSVRARFSEITPLKRLEITHIIDFVPGAQAYENRSRVEFFQEGRTVRMVVTVDPHHDPEWTQRASMGWESQLRKLPAA